MSDKPYYMDQSNWSSAEFYCLHRYLHRLILHYEKKKEEVGAMDPGQMSERTKVLIYCIIKYYQKDELFALENLRSIKECTPLEEPLVIGNHNIKGDDVYERMNVVL